MLLLLLGDFRLRHTVQQTAHAGDVGVDHAGASGGGAYFSSTAGAEA